MTACGDCDQCITGNFGGCAWAPGNPDGFLPSKGDHAMFYDEYIDKGTMPVEQARREIQAERKIESLESDLKAAHEQIQSLKQDNLVLRGRLTGIRNIIKKMAEGN